MFRPLTPTGIETEVSLDSSETVVYVFKTMSEAHFGELSFFRVYSGSVTAGTDLFNSDRKTNERIGQIYLLNGQTREAVPTLGAGDIGAVVKLKVTHTGNTLCTPKHPVTLPKVVYPKPNIHAALVAKVKGEEDKIASGLAALHDEDPTFLYVVDSELHQTIISAQGELHLEVVADRLRRRHNVHVELAEPRVKYRETIKAQGRFKVSPQETDRRRGTIRRGLDAHRAQAARHRRGVHQLARRAERGPQFRAVRREGREPGLHRGHHRRLPRDGRED